MSGPLTKAETQPQLLTSGSCDSGNLKITGQDLNGIHFAMPFLTQQNRRIAGDIIPENEVITAEEKHVIIIGGGDTPGINRHLIQH